MDDLTNWAEHGNRTWIREKRRYARPALVIGLILVVACAVVWWLGLELPDWLGFVYFMAAFMGVGLVIASIAELLDVRKMEQRVRRGRDVCTGMEERHESAHRCAPPWRETQEPACDP